MPPEQNELAETQQKRYHDYDALRACAMLLGIVLHGVMSFIELPPGMWPAQDVQQNTSVYGFVLHALHGFRLPLFFMMSGFFTTMLWRKRGLRKLIAHRAKRILLPLVVCWFAVWPALIVVGIVGANGQANIWDAAANGKADEVERYLASGGDSEARFDLPGIPGSGATPLHLAVAGGHEEVTKLLLEHGANVNSIAKDRDRGTPLHWAVRAQRLESVEILVEAGADIHAEDGNGHTPHDLATGVKPVEEMSATIAAYLHSKGATERDIEVERSSVVSAQMLGLLLLLFCFAPFFAHLWFLWYLCWLVVGFLIVVWLAQRLHWKRLPSRAISSPYCWFWLLPLTLLAQLCMVQTFGPDTGAGLIPWPPVLAYYAIFFGFGAVLYGDPRAEQSLGQHWKICLLLGLATLPVGIWLFETRPGGNMITLFDFESPTVEFPRRDLDLGTHFLTSLCAVVYCWSMILALMGLFRRYFCSDNARIRYISDSAYWLYVAHLPLIQFMQVLVRDWSCPSIVKIIIICVATVSVLLVIYEYGVRYTFVGTMLNGKKYRGNPPKKTGN
ncbi:MAG: acyltransferase family protein [Planctomycetes bacterium]|nr:acyltransferase family protein [Planctomycetota bacterium]MBL7039517.1 acyltransferase family protein [Pirellulaceae bacterium]